MANLTKKEIDVLKAYRDNWMLVELDWGCYVDQLLDSTDHKHDIQPNQLSGIVSSLVKKDLIDTDGENIVATKRGIAVIEGFED